MGLYGTVKSCYSDHHIATNLIGVISDTHGVVRPEARAQLDGVDLILHAGDVGKPQVLDDLRAIAPLIAVRGNVDRGAWADVLPVTTIVEVGAARLLLLHNIANLPDDLHGIHAVIYGHSHIAVNETRNGVLYLNPGSIGPRRFRLPVTMVLLEVSDLELAATVLDLNM